MYEKFLALAQKMESNDILDSIKRGFLLCLPLLMIGIFSYVVLSLPFAFVQDWYQSTWVGVIMFRFFDAIYRLTFGAVSLYLTVFVSYMYAARFYTGTRIVLAASVLANFFSVLFSLGFAHTGMDGNRYDAQGVFTAFVVSIISTKIFFLIFNGLMKKRSITEETGITRRIKTFYWMMVPFSSCIFIFYCLNELLYHFLHVSSLGEAMALGMSQIFIKMGASLWSAIIMVVGESVMWFFGVHGGSVMEQVNVIVFSPANTDATQIISRTFLDTFTLMGGCGTAFALFIAMLLFEKRKEKKAILRTVAFPIIFNVNEPLVFGVPVILNPILLIPFIVTPVVSLIIAYGATAIGFMPVTTTEVSWITPIFLSGYMATGSWRGCVVQAVILLVGVGIYAPFVKMMGNLRAENKDASADKLEKLFIEHMDQPGKLEILKQHNSWGITGTAIVSALKDDIANEKIQLYYQPQIDQAGQVYGAEALLRWRYAGKMMFPPFVIHMANEAGVEDQLERAIIRQVCKDIAKMKEVCQRDMRISVNISSAQLDDNIFVTDIILIAKTYHVTNQLCVEITEELSVQGMKQVAANIKRLNKEGIEVSMDDFSMGTTSIKNLRENNFSHVKLDGALISDMENNERSRDIVASIISLGDTLGFKVVAEYVDSQTKLDKLKSLGCDYFQGYYYSPAVPLEEFVDYANRREE